MFSVILILSSSLPLIQSWGDNGRLRSQVRNLPSDVPSGMYSCNDDGDKMCSANLEGYYQCLDWDLDKKNLFKCPQGTRCGCNLEDRICKLEPICIPTKTPYPMPPKATFYYNGSYTDDYYGNYPKDFKERTGIWGVVKQDVENKKYLQVITMEDTYPGNNFELIVPDVKGNIVKYNGNSRTGKCYKKIISAFVPFGYDIKYYHLFNSEELEGGKSQQTWRIKAFYETIIGHDMSWKWVILADPLTQTSKPIKTYFFTNGLDSDHEGTYSKTQVVHWSTHSLDAAWGDGIDWYLAGRSDNDWFKIPDYC